ncbi:hypothetical protein RJ640_019307 [Escallonia rubra]|uniref:Uncharacterized protein n=1 Tax=Escallonia rubra TaxID=112253 RepID=A0AA88RUE0_9ASTE|nr:hypothetical protein RJ640_019307 [Escallonia rubra]
MRSDDGEILDKLKGKKNTNLVDEALRAKRDSNEGHKIANFLANNLNRNWPHDLFERVARSL